MLSKSIPNREKVKRAGFPRIEDYPEEIKLNKNEFRQYMREKIIDMDDPTISNDVKDRIEFVVDMTNPEEHKLEITLKPNATRAAEQKALRDEIIKSEQEAGTYDTRLDKNVLILYIDNISRAHFYRKMPLTVEWLNQYAGNKDSEYATYQYFKYHSVFYNTLFSNDALYFGAIKHVKDSSDNVFDSFSRNGYMTGFFKDSCETASTSIQDPELRMHKWDHLGGGIS